MKRSTVPTQSRPPDAVARNADRRRSLLGFARLAAVVAVAAGALPPELGAQNTYRIGVGTCLGCAICINLSENGPYPVRGAQLCSTGGCAAGADPVRFADLTSHRGLLQVVTSTNNPSCSYSVIGIASWDANNSPAGADVYFTGPSGVTSVMTRVRYRVSTSGSAGSGFTLNARFQNQWANGMAVPANVSDFEIVSPLTEIGLNFWRTCDARIESSVVDGSTCYLLHFPLNEPVFDLPPGYTANSPTLGIVDNIWQGLDVEGDWDAATGDVACFSALPLLHSVAGNLIVSNTTVTNILLDELVQVGGVVVITNNTAATNVDLGSLTSSGGLEVTGNGTTGLFRGGSPASLAIDLSSLSAVNGDLNVSANLQDPAVVLDSLAVVDGDLTLETVVDGELDLSAAAVFGSIDVEGLDADAVTLSTPEVAGAATTIGITRDESSLAVELPADTFAASEIFAVAHVGEASWTRGTGLDASGAPVRLSLLAVYSVDAPGDPVLQQDATLALELNLGALPAAVQTALVDALADGLIVLAQRLDAPRSLYQLLATAPELFDANHAPWSSGGSEPIAFVRFTTTTDVLAEYAIALVGEPPHAGQSGAPLPGGSVGPVIPFTASRNGSNLNLPALVEAAPAVIGSAWRAALAIEAERTALFLSWNGAAEGVFIAGGELLLQTPLRSLPHGALSLPIPHDPRLLGLTFSAQAAVLVGGSWRLTNALDVTIGNAR